MALKFPGKLFHKPGTSRPSQVNHGRGDGLHIVLHGKVAGDENLRGAVTALRERGRRVEVSVTWEPGDAERFAARAASDPAVGTVVAAGGDGMINTVVTGIMDSGVESLPRLAVLPMGTANDFARACGIDSDVYSALALAAAGDAWPVDVGRVNDQYFLNVATGGFGTDVTINTPPELKKLLGGAAYLLTGIRQADSISARYASFSGPDFTWSGGFLAMAVGNGRYAGGGVPMCEHACIDNGYFDLTILPEVRIEQLPEVLSVLMEKGFGAQALEAHLVRARAHSFAIHSETPLQINLDGEPLQSDRFEFEVMDRAIRLHLPPDTDILSAP